MTASGEVQTWEVPTAQGPARAQVHPGAAVVRAQALLLHGAGSSTQTADLLALADALAAAGITAVRFDQPYVVREGRRPPAPARTLDATLTEAVVALTGLGVLTPGLPLLLAGRSSGARVACRVAVPLGALAVVALGFPLTPAVRPAAGAVRIAELTAAGVPVLVLQGTRDGFGGPEDVAALALPDVEVHAVAGADHSFAVRRVDGRSSVEVITEVATVAARWLAARLP
jgi:predicted alpha/beta-hydrolase family hydrolase